MQSIRPMRTVSQASTDTNPLFDYLDISSKFRNPDGTIART
jgi:hypothetical protein